MCRLASRTSGRAWSRSSDRVGNTGGRCRRPHRRPPAPPPTTSAARPRPPNAARPTTRSRRPARRSSRADPRVLRVIEWLTGELETHPAAEHLDLAARADPGVGRQIGIGDRALDGEALATARHPTDDVAVDPHRLVAKAYVEEVVEHQAAQP